MEYYALIMLSVAMFGGGFALQDVYRKKRGSGLKISMESAFIGSLAGLLVLLIINGANFSMSDNSNSLNFKQITSKKGSQRLPLLIYA